MSALPKPPGLLGCHRSTTTDSSEVLLPAPVILEDLVRAAYDDLATRLERFFGFRLADAYRLLGAVGKVRIGQVVPPVFSAMAKIERKYTGPGDEPSH